jgi:hypothetical protein
MLGDRGELLVKGLDDAVELGMNGLGVGLVVDGVQQRFDPAPAALRGRGHEVRGVVSATPLPGGTGDGRSDRNREPGVGVAGDELDAGQAAGGQVAEERQPAGAVLARGDLDAEDLAVPVGIDAGRDEHVDRHHPPTLTDLEHQGVGRDEGERTGVGKASGAELLNVLVELLGHH